MDDATWRLIFRVAFLVALIAITVGIPVVCVLLYRVHLAQGHILNGLLAWARDTNRAAPEGVTLPVPDDPISMGMDFGVGAVLFALRRAWAWTRST